MTMRGRSKKAVPSRPASRQAAEERVARRWAQAVAVAVRHPATVTSASVILSRSQVRRFIMPRVRTALSGLLTALLWVPASAGEVELNGKRFVLADGLTIELAAAAPLTERPICVDFDDKGRLYVAESSGTNDPAKQQLIDQPHSILRLEDTDGDGVFDKRTVFAEKLMFPEGCEWHEGSLYIGAPPHIWKFTDTNDDGVADEREVWFDGKTLTGCANDLHGP